MEYYNHILDTIGNTPLVKVGKIIDSNALILVKVESFNPGHSTKDRMALKMIEDAEERGVIKPGATIIEGTSGNTGMGLALVCIERGYKLICTISDKQSKEKIDILKAMGAEVVICPTNVPPDHPDSYYSVAKRLNKEISNSFYPNQYDNLSNRLAHYESTGPEIWKQTDGKVTHFVVGVGTGGTTDEFPVWFSLPDEGCDCIPNNRPFPVGIDNLYCNRYEMAEFAKDCQSKNINFIGVCCGAAPHHVREMAVALGRKPISYKYYPDMSKHFILGTDKTLSSINTKHQDKYKAEEKWLPKG